MNLVWALYKNKRRLLLYIGESNGKLVVFDDHHIPQKELQIIRHHHQSIDKLSISEKMLWFKKNTPLSYKMALRTLDQKHTVILNTVKIPIAQKLPAHQTI